MIYLDSLAETYLEDALKKCAFNAMEYFLGLEEGSYLASQSVFYDILRHPTIVWDYRVRDAIQQGFLSNELHGKTTVFNSVSKYHLEFMNGVVIFKIVKKENK